MKKKAPLCVAKVYIKASGKLFRYVVLRRMLMSFDSPQLMIYINSLCITFSLIQWGPCSAKFHHNILVDKQVTTWRKGRLYLLIPKEIRGD